MSVNLAVALQADGLDVDNTGDDDVSTLTLTNSTADQSFELGAGTAVDVTVSGTKDLELATGSTAKSVNATGLSGVLETYIDGTTDIKTVTGGSANDIFNVAAAPSQAVTLDGGAGTADTFEVSADSSFATIAFSNIEVFH